MIQQPPFQVFKTHLQKECKLGFQALGQNVKPCFYTISLSPTSENLLWGSGYLPFFVAVIFWHPLSCSIFLPFTDSNYNLKRDSIVYTDENPTALPPNFSFSWSSKTFTWTPSRLVIPRVAVEGRRQIFMPLISDTKLPLADHNPSLACDLLVFTLLNLRETPSSWFLKFFPSRQPRFGFSSIFNHPSAMFCFLTGFPIICSVTEFPSEYSQQLKMIGFLDEWLVFVRAVSSVPCLMSSLSCPAQGLTDSKWIVRKHTWNKWKKGRTHGRRW